MQKDSQSLLFDVPATGVKVRPRQATKLPPVDVAPMQEKWNRLPEKYKRVVPNPGKIDDRRSFWLTPEQVGSIVGGLTKQGVIDMMYEGIAFGSCCDVGSDPDQPYFRILLEDAIDFLLKTKIGADEERDF